MSLLKKRKTSVYRTEAAEPDEELEIEEQSQRVVEKVLRWKKTGRGQPPAYLILWQGCPPEEATWEAANRFNSEDFRRWVDRDQPPEDISNERGRS